MWIEINDVCFVLFNLGRLSSRRFFFSDEFVGVLWTHRTNFRVCTFLSVACLTAQFDNKLIEKSTANVMQSLQKPTALSTKTMDNQRHCFMKTSPNAHENPHRFFVVASATDNSRGFFYGLSEGVPAPLGLYRVIVPAKRG